VNFSNMIRDWSLVAALKRSDELAGSARRCHIWRDGYAALTCDLGAPADQVTLLETREQNPADDVLMATRALSANDAADALRRDFKSRADVRRAGKS
jgi:hypothetical protein